MKINSAEFVSSLTGSDPLPAPDKPEFAFIGRSNVGKSSLINMLAGRKNLARTSATPGKTQTINHFLINHAWYLVDLPGYGFARVSQQQRKKWQSMIYRYLLNRKNLYMVFVLIDPRIPPQKSDLSFISFLGENQIPLAVAFTKCDKLTAGKLKINTAAFLDELSKSWESLPACFYTSAHTGQGRARMLAYLNELMKTYQPPV